MAESSKKRKRSTEDNKKPGKKVAIEAHSPGKKVTVSVLPNTDEWAPIVVSTPGLALPPSITLQPYTKRRKNAPVRPRESGAIATTELLLHSSEHTSIDYLGREEEVGSADSLLKHYVGIYDPATGKLEVMEARKMIIRGTVRSQAAAPEALAEKKTLTNAQLRNDLGQTFGTKKARKAIAAITENAISPNKTARQTSPGGTQRMKLDSVATVILETMEKATGGMATSEELSAAVDEAKARPKANLDAKNVKDVYTTESLIGEDILKLVPAKDWQDAVKAKREVITKSKYVAHRLQMVAKDVQKLRVLRYLLCLLEFFGCSKPTGKTTKGARKVPQKDKLRAAISDVPEAVVEHIRRKFSTDSAIQKNQADLLITHVCALALIIDNFEVDMYDLREDLHLELKEISQYFHELGAKIGPANEEQRKKLGLDKAAGAHHKFAKLKLPLDFPKAIMRRKR